jgi:hypothetical protein
MSSSPVKESAGVDSGFTAACCVMSGVTAGAPITAGAGWRRLGPVCPTSSRQCGSSAVQRGSKCGCLKRNSGTTPSTAAASGELGTRWRRICLSISSSNWRKLAAEGV